MFLLDGLQALDAALQSSVGLCRELLLEPEIQKWSAPGEYMGGLLGLFVES